MFQLADDPPMDWGAKRNTHLVVTGVAIVIPSLLNLVSPLLQDRNKVRNLDRRETYLVRLNLVFEVGHGAIAALAEHSRQVVEKQTT
jgi:hypothetical protein